MTPEFLLDGVGKKKCSVIPKASSLFFLSLHRPFHHLWASAAEHFMPCWWWLINMFKARWGCLLHDSSPLIMFSDIIPELSDCNCSFLPLDSNKNTPKHTFMSCFVYKRFLVHPWTVTLNNIGVLPKNIYATLLAGPGFYLSLKIFLLFDFFSLFPRNILHELLNPGFFLTSVWNEQYVVLCTAPCYTFNSPQSISGAREDDHVPTYCGTMDNRCSHPFTRKSDLGILKK